MIESGFASIVQYQPDAARQEAANVGLVLLCPAVRRLDIKMVTGVGHVQRFFGKGVEGEFLADMKRAFEGRLRAEARDIHSAAELAAFAGRLGNEIRMTEPRGVAMIQPYDVLLDELFGKLVAEPKVPRSARSALGRRLRAFFDGLPEQDRITRNERLHLPVVETVEAPYAYLNGALNLVKPIALGDKARDEARSWLLVDQILRANAHRFERPPKIEIVLARADSPPERAQRDYCEEVLAHGQAKVFSEDHLDEFKRHVVKNLAHR